MVTSDKMTKGRVVELEHLSAHPLYGKVMVKRKRVMAHDEREISALGDRVRLISSRPISKRKRWRVMSVLEKGTG